MKRWRQWLWRLLVAVGSLVLSLVLLAGVGLLIGKLIIDRQLAEFGVTEWSVELASVSSRHIAFERISLTIDQRPETQPTVNEQAPMTLGSLLETSLPTWLPEKITVSELVIQGAALGSYSSVKAQLSLTTEPLKLDLQLQSPESGKLVASRNGNDIMVNATHSFGQASLDYQSSNGQLGVDAQLDIPQLSFETPATALTISTGVVDLSVKGTLSPNVVINDMNDVIQGFSALVTLNLPDNSELNSDILATQLGGDLELQLSNGIVERYRLLLRGDLSSWPKLPLPVDNIKWQFGSQDQLAIEATDYQQLLNKPRWPLEFATNINGEAVKQLVVKGNGSLILDNGEFRQLQLPQIILSADSLRLEHLNNQLQQITTGPVNFTGNLTVNSEQLLIGSSGKPSTSLPTSLSTQLFTPYGKFDITMREMSANLPLNDIQNLDASAMLKFDNFSELSLPINSAPINDIDPQINTQLAYHSGSLSATGDIQLTQNLIAKHTTTVTPELQLSSALQLDLQQLGESTDASSQKALNRLVQQFAPLLSISSTSGAVSAELKADLNSGHWQVNDGHVALNKVDFIYDTLSVANANLNADFQVDETQINVSDGSLGIGSVQQGFSVGPLDADFTANVPFADPAASNLYLGQHQINAFGGSITLPEQNYSLNQSFQMPVVFEHINLGELLRQYPTNKIAIDGAVSGTIPLSWDSQQLTVNNGYLNALSPGGHLQVDSSALSSAVGTNPSLQTLAGVLENFYYQELSSVIDYDKDNKLMLQLHLQGFNPDVENGRTVNLNLTIEEDIPALIKGLQLSTGVSDVIRERIQKRVN